MISLHMVNVRRKKKDYNSKSILPYTQIFNTENFIHMEIYYIKRKRQLQLCRAYNTRTCIINQFLHHDVNI